jgi:uncharacterized protein with PIN domain
METFLKLEERFERCPKCGAVIKFKPGTDVTVCEKCKIKIRLRK